MTHFVTMPIDHDDDGELVAGEVHERQSAGAAESVARCMSESAAGVAAFLRKSDPATGEFTYAVVLRQSGEVPSLEDLLNGE